MVTLILVLAGYLTGSIAAQIYYRRKRRREMRKTLEQGLHRTPSYTLRPDAENPYAQLNAGFFNDMMWNKDSRP